MYLFIRLVLYCINNMNFTDFLETIYNILSDHKIKKYC